MASVPAEFSAVFKAMFSSLTFENAKTALFIYVLLSYMLQTKRHLRANGLRHTIYDAWVWLQKVRYIHPDIFPQRI